MQKMMQKAFFTPKTVFSVSSSPERGAFFKMALMEDPKNTGVLVSPTLGELIMLKEALEHYRDGGPQRFEEYAKKYNSIKSAQMPTLGFIHKLDDRTSSFGAVLIKKEANQNFGFFIKISEGQNTDKRFFPLDRLTLLTLIEIIDKKMIPDALEYETVYRQQQKNKQTKSYSRENSDDYIPNYDPGF